MAWIYCAPASVGANLGWHDLGVRAKSSTHGVDLLRPGAWHDVRRGKTA